MTLSFFRTTHLLLQSSHFGYGKCGKANSHIFPCYTSIHRLQPNKEVLFVRRLRRWYRLNGRVYPWRRTSNPYEVWIAEALLQRTRADIVAREYSRVLRAFPTIERLASSQLDDIRETIRNMGLLHRAGYLKSASIYILENFSGKFPQVEQTLSARALIASISLFLINSRILSQSDGGSSTNLSNLLS